VDYEELWLDPATTVQRVHAAIGLADPTEAVRRVRRPSATAGRGSVVVSGGDPRTAWRQGLAREAVAAIRDVVGMAGLDRDLVWPE
jgi:hypothetical protein